MAILRAPFASGGLSEIDVSIGPGGATWEYTYPLVLTPVSGGTAVISVPQATSVDVDGTGSSNTLSLSCTGASVVNLGGLSVAALTLAVGSPTLTLPTSVTSTFDFTGTSYSGALNLSGFSLSYLRLILGSGGATFTMPSAVSGTFILNSSTVTSLTIPAAVTHVDISASSLVSMTTPVLTNAIASFVCNAPLNQASVDQVLSRIAAAGWLTNVTLGGASASPTIDVYPQPGGGGISVQNDASNIENGNWFKPRWKNTERYFWFSYYGSGTDPFPGGTGVEVPLDTWDDQSSIATKLVNAMNANGYSAFSSGPDVSYYLTEPGAGSMNASQNSDDMLMTGEWDGTNAGSYAVNAIRSRGGVVVHN